METKVCARCRIDKDVSNFYIKRTENRINSVGVNRVFIKNKALDGKTEKERYPR